jgi:hypothetical protein
VNVVESLAPHLVPGWRETCEAVHDLRELVVDGFGGHAPTVEQTVAVALAVSRPHVQAELLADLADEFAEVAPAFAEMLDQISYDMRKAVTR